MWKNLSKLILLVVLVLFVFLWMAKAEVLSSYLSSKLRLPVSISSMGFWPSHAKIRNFQIKNPRGFKTKTAFSAKEIEIDYQLRELYGDPLRLEAIAVDQAFLSIEFSNPLGTKNNWTEIAGKIRSKKKGKEVIVDQLILKDLTVKIQGLGLSEKPQTKRIEKLVFHNINSKQGFPTEALIQAIFGGAGIQEYIQEAFNPENVLDEFLNPFE